jgi:hypothetical protein
MREIDSFFSEEPDRQLYHYTGIGALLGMANGNNLWASNIFYLNDSKEITHACDVLESVLEYRFIFGNPQSPELKFLKQLQAWVSSCRTTTYNIFVFSLSEVPSLLSQWRSYTPHGKGVCIGFSQKKLKHIAKMSSFRIAKCLYENQDQEDLLIALIEKLLITFRQESPNIDLTLTDSSQCYYPFLERFRGDVLQVLSIIKHKAFKEEAEWRLISPYFPRSDIPEIKFREGASMLMPYIELSLGNELPYFETVILGPSQHKNLSMSALSMFLSNKGLCNSPINCEIPYREW